MSYLFFNNIFTPLSYIISFYFITLFFCTLLRQYITIKGIFFLLSSNLGFLLILLCFFFDDILLKNNSYTWEGLLLTDFWGFPELGLNLYLDALSFLFMFLVSIIGFGTNIYILNYFKHEANEDSFTLLINWFILSMIVLVLANNLFTLFLGWELIGLTSFFLINFWNERRGTLKSAFKAFVFNKLSDFFLFIFVVLVWFLTNQSHLNLINLTVLKLFDSNNVLWFICIISLILCSSIKSAQIIGHLWLPDSMEAPVPASALIHSATLVSAGLYLLLRFNTLIIVSGLSSYILFLGSLTAAYGGVVAAAQTDVKKLLAYSTISHCGFLFVCVALNNSYLVIIYLFLHGLFKALTFFCVGSFIRISNSQDTRQMGILSRYLPLDTVLLIICASNLGGLPFTLGYLYKNFFLSILTVSSAGFIIVGFCYIGMLTSLVYVYRLIYYCAFDINKGFLNLSLKKLQDNNFLDKSYWSNSTLVYLVSVYILLGFAIYTYIVLFTYSSFIHLTLDQYPLFFQSNKFCSINSELLYSYYINYFYSLYFVVIGVLTFIECRKTYTWKRKIHFILFLIIFTFIIVLILI